MIKNILKKLLPLWIQNHLSQIIILINAIKPIAPRICNICEFQGYFKPMGRPAKLDARCPKCRSLERDRLLMLALDRKNILLPTAESMAVLHFAPEPRLEQIFRNKWDNYKTADLFKPADLKLNLEKINLPDKSVDLIIANHVLEHVDDKKASRELNRILKKNGLLICMVPIIEGWAKTYENETIKTDLDRTLHFGQRDHLRFYGKDFRQRIEQSGLQLTQEITAEGQDVITYGLVRGEKVFCFKKI